MAAQNKRTFLIYAGIVLAILVIFNIINRNWFFRWDLTDNKMYSLSESSKSVINKIDDRLTMKVYFSKDPGDQLSNIERFLQDMLEEYEAYSNGNIYFEFYRPDDDEKLQEEAQKSGIRPVQVQDFSKDEISVKQVYLGMALLYEDKRETIPLIQNTTGLEYTITTKIKKLVDTNKPNIAIAKTSGQEEIKNDNISQLLSQRYDVRNITLDQKVPDNISTILINGIGDSLSVDEYTNLETFINQGGNLLLGQNRIKTDLATQQANPVESNIFSLLDLYGLHIAPNLVLDLNCGKVNVQQNLGFIRIPVPMDYPFLPIIKEESFNDDNVMVSGLEGLRMMFPSELLINDSLTQNEAVKITPLFTSSNNSTTMEEFYNLNPDPKANPAFRQLNEVGKVLSALAEVTNPDAGISQLIVISDSKFFADAGGGSSPENHIFIMNAVDYLLGDRELISLRSREITQRPLEELEHGERLKWKWINFLLPPVLVISFGIIRIRRDGKRGKMLEEIYD